MISTNDASNGSDVASAGNQFTPHFFYLSAGGELERLNRFRTENPNIIIADEYEGQLREYVKLLHPTRPLSESETATELERILGGKPMQEHGNWVYYPWINTLVHVLEEGPFIAVRTNRNKYKITDEEREILSNKIVGVIGLSVGQSISLTMAMERTFGEIRLADFDDLELTNLNRIRSGLHELGMSKVVIAAREIKEIDPYLKVKIFPEGITPQNIDEYITGGGKMDILVDECDSLEIKVLCRMKAKEYKIPVVMDTSDRGMVDIERFDLDPNRPIFHGLIEHLNLADLEKAKTNEDKIPFMLPMVGLVNCSERMQASLLELNQTITSWPQLASSVTLGGGVAADVCRKIMLEQTDVSGRYYVDMDDIIYNAEPPPLPDLSKPDEADLLLHASPEEKYWLSLINKLPENTRIAQTDLAKDIVSQIVEMACDAPSGGNCQPWKWLYKDKILYLFHEKARSESLLDYKHTGSYLAMGAAIENLVLKSHELGYEVETDLFPLTAADELIATFRFYHSGQVPAGTKTESHDFDHLIEGVLRRVTNRKVDKKVIIEESRLQNLKHVVGSMPGAKLHLATSENDIKQICDIIATVDKLIFTNKETHQYFIKEIRWTPEEAELKRDGLDIETLELSAGEMTGIKIAKNWSVVKYLGYWKSGSVFEKISRKALLAASAIGMVSMPKFSSIDFINGGRAIQRMWIAANQDNIALQPHTPVTFFFNRLKYGNGEGFGDAMKNDLLAIRPKFEQVFGIDQDIGEIFLFRLFEAGEPKTKALRRHLEDMLTIY